MTYDELNKLSIEELTLKLLQVREENELLNTIDSVEDIVFNFTKDGQEHEIQANDIIVRKMTQEEQRIHFLLDKKKRQVAEYVAENLKHTDFYKEIEQLKENNQRLQDIVLKLNTNLYAVYKDSELRIYEKEDKTTYHD
ncbi:hypothetical protein MUN82_01795 [Hymenobacter aerilatus]|uniref:Uncharacterized protein n=1 Tax=Hymenobacter aerilatus TaxID=2932251 RepID=A0A8T9SYN6_9BACT|nr:hypothetical protein [Hymenobacter aerilatus]UOR05843.1 hypothetical protein MUN82_01795 [Hymenobacter aerilatus]